MAIRTGVSRMVFLLLAWLLTVDTTYAQQTERDRRDRQETRQAQAVSKRVYDILQQAQEKIAEEDYRGALRLLDDLTEKGGLSDYERSRVLQHAGIVHYIMGDTNAAIAAFEEMLRIPSLEVPIRTQTVYTLAQLNTAAGEHARATELLEEWFTLATNPDPDPYILYAQNLYQLSRFSEMIRPIETAMDVARERHREVKEDWYALLNFAYFQQEDYAKVRDIHKTLLVNWPKKKYWLSLAGAYTELGEADNVIYAYDAAHTQGLLETESELVTMAQLYLQAEVPYKAATLLDGEMKAGRIARTARHYRLLSQAWTLSQEESRAIPALQQAARLSDDGELDVRLGNAYLNLGRYAECTAAVRSGLRKGGLKNPDNAQISLGMCLYNQAEYAESMAAFREAAKTRRSRHIAGQWIRVIETEVDRNEQIQQVEAEARRLIRALEERRESRAGI